ncbi:MAG: guanylate kinase [Planctomycetota bacterium]
MANPSSSEDSTGQERHGLLLVICGPSGVGKTTITRRLVEHYDAVFSVSATTRPRTKADEPGRDYHFVSEDEFLQLIDQQALLEHALVFGNRYGTLRAPVESSLRAGRVVVLEIDVQGALQVREQLPEAFLVFILPPAESTLLDRLRARKREPEDRIQARFREAKREITVAKESGAYDMFVVNDDLERAVAEIAHAVDAVMVGGGRVPTSPESRENMG